MTTDPKIEAAAKAMFEFEFGDGEWATATFEARDNYWIPQARNALAAADAVRVDTTPEPPTDDPEPDHYGRECIGTFYAHNNFRPDDDGEWMCTLPYGHSGNHDWPEGQDTIDRSTYRPGPVGDITPPPQEQP